MTQIFELEASELKEAKVYWSVAHSCPIYVVQGGGTYVIELDQDGDVFFDEAQVNITTPQVKQSIFQRFFNL